MMLTRPFTILLVAVVALGRAALGAPEQLVVFVAPGASPVAADFQATHLPRLRALAAELDVPLEIRDVSGGAPEEIAITPLVVYQNARGRSVYQGRYTTLDRLRNFVRVARAIPGGDQANQRTSTPVRRQGRAAIATPVKVTALSGDRPDGFDDVALARAMTAGVAKGMDGFELVDKIALRPADRMFYVDVHPYRTGDLLYLTVELYSQFHCHDPIFSALDDPVLGWWDDRDEAFAEVGRLVGAEIAGQIASPARGDGFDVVGADVPAPSWEAIGLSLPERSEDRGGAVAADVRLPRTWRVPAAEADAEPPVLFRFPAPLDSYAGTVTRMAGELRLGDETRLEGAAGHFEVRTATLTMGEPTLDEALHSSLFFDVSKHPTSRFEITSIEPLDGELAFGRLAPAVMHGTFTLKGVPLPLSVRATFEPIVDEAGRPRLLLEADWTLRLAEPFGLQGPDGPAPANDTVLLRCRAMLEAE